MTSKALHCYIFLSIWILILIVGIYKFLEPKQQIPVIPVAIKELLHKSALDIKTKRIFKFCNLPEDIAIGDEGIFGTKRWTLKGILILIRHGDRGPLQHVRNISYVNCGSVHSTYLKSYQEYLHNLTLSGKISWVGPGPFHAFPIIPSVNQCQLGQLTMQGVAQLNKLGYILQQSYMKIWPQLMHLSPGEIVVYSTKYRRTFQSALAFLYGLILPETLSKIAIRESPSMSFCFKDCGCPVAEHYNGNVKKYITQLLISHPAVGLLSENIGNVIFPSSSGTEKLGDDPYFVRDALLTYICHGSGLPCGNSQNCIRKHNIAGIFSYTDWVSHQKWANSHWKHYCLLKAYGLIKHIVSQMLHMVSNSGPYLILYSGHDYTLEQLSTALGLKNDPLLFRYAARIIFEVYHDNKVSQNGASDIYFRILSNGKDVTKSASFCKEFLELSEYQQTITLCKIENIVRFIHDDYFSSLNFTNFKESCILRDF